MKTINRRLYLYLYWSRMAARSHLMSLEYRDPAKPLPDNVPEDWREGFVAASQRIAANAACMARKQAKIEDDETFG